MFFATPKVKSLSRYTEYGTYLGYKHFLIMLGIAFTLHMAIIAVYSMVPREKVVRIPVRALNIKLTGGSMGNGIHMPLISSMPEVKAPGTLPDAASQIRTEPAKPEEKAVEPLKKPMPDAVKEEVPLPPVSIVGKKLHQKNDAHKNSPVFTFPTPKKYVRENQTSSAAPGKVRNATNGGNGSQVNGDVGGQEIITRYSQTISQWIKNHQDYARAAYAEATQGQASVTGQTVIRLRITREGHILLSSVDRTSGNELVDAAAIAMVRASDPLPQVPSNYPSDTQLEFLIAVQVDLSKH